MSAERDELTLSWPHERPASVTIDKDASGKIVVRIALEPDPTPSDAKVPDTPTPADGSAVVEQRADTYMNKGLNS